jgi:hypothetical protein
MPTLMPWTTVEIGDVDLFSPSLPSLVVYTWYVDDEPESSVVYFWRDEDTGIVHHELNVAPKDGTVIGSLVQSTPVDQVFKEPGVQFDASRFNWIGR